MADAIIDPDNTGATRVFPTSTITSTGDLAGNDVTIGFSGGAGALEINAANASNGVTSLQNIDDLTLSQFENEDSLLRVVGNGTAGSASVNTTGDFRLGSNSNSTLEIRDGGQVSNLSSAADSGAFGVLIGSYADFRPGQGNASILVDGAGSLLESAGGGIDVGFSSPGGVDSLTVSNGGKVVSRQANDVMDVYNDTGDVFVLADGQVFVGDDFDDGETDTVTVTGAGSTFEYASGYFASSGNTRTVVTGGGQLVQVEQGGIIDLLVAESGGTFAADDLGIAIGTIYDEGSLLVSGQDGSGTASTVASTRDIRIGGGETFSGFDADFNPLFAPRSGSVVVEQGAVLQTDMQVDVSRAEGTGSGELIVRTGGTVFADVVNVYGGGVLSGAGGTIDGHVIVDGGTLAPGASPGTMTILGDLTLTDGVLELEFDAPGVADLLLVDGDIFIGGDISIQLVLGFLPTEVVDLEDFFGDFDTLAFGSDFDLLTNVDVFYAGSAPANGTIVTVAANGGMAGFALAASPVPAPGAAALFGLSALFLAGAARRRERRG